MDLVLPNDFKEFLRLLRFHGVSYLLIGGYAVGYYGYPRATGDLDVWIARTQTNAENVVAALEGFGFGAPELVPELFLREQSMVRLGHVPLRIEILTGVSGVTFDECYPDRHETVIDGTEVTVISLARLRVNKKASGRPKDLDDLLHLPIGEE